MQIIVQTVADSNEMLKRPEAASIKETGRFYLQVGYDELVGMTFYHLSDNGYEKTLKENLDRIKREAEDDIVERNYTE